MVVVKESEARSDIYTGSESNDDYPFRPVTFFPTTISVKIFVKYREY
jgi:hypothetical protein